MIWTILLFSYLLKNYEAKTAHLILGLLIFISYAVILQAQKGSLGGGATNTIGYLGATGMLRGCGGIGLGYFIGLWYKNHTPSILVLWKKVFVSIIEFCCIFFIINNLIVKKINEPNNIIFIIVFVLTIVLFLRKEGIFTYLLDKPFLYSISKYSYSIYMVHVLLFDIFKHTIWQNKKIVESFPLLQIGLAIISSIILGIMTYHLIEVPGKRFLNRFFSASKKEDF